MVIYINASELLKKNPPGKGGEETWGAADCTMEKHQCFNIQTLYG
jgi:hypothetical protein